MKYYQDMLVLDYIIQHAKLTLKIKLHQLLLLMLFKFAL